MKKSNGFLLLSPNEFVAWIDKQTVARGINRIQQHHTWSPSYKHFTGDNHFARQQAMKDSHLARNFSDIAQHFTIFPDGMIVTGRPLSQAPAGIVGANTGAICIENFGNFDVGGDAMTDAQAKAIILVTAAMCKRFNLDPSEAITYHAWWTAAGDHLGDYSKAKSAKSCPGTAFFDGNTKQAFQNSFLSLVQNAIKETQSVQEEEEMKVYKYVPDMPKWAQDTFTRLVQAGFIAKDTDGAVNVQECSLQPMVYIDRLMGGQIEHLPEIIKFIDAR